MEWDVVIDRLELCRGVGENDFHASEMNSTRRVRRRMWEKLIETIQIQAEFKPFHELLSAAPNYPQKLHVMPPQTLFIYLWHESTQRYTLESKSEEIKSNVKDSLSWVGKFIFEKLWMCI